MIMTVIIDELSKRQQFSSHCLIFESVSSQIVFDNSIQGFTLIISLRVISDRELPLNYLNLTDFLSKVRDNSRISIHNNASQEAKSTFNMLKKQLCEICSCSIISDEYKQSVFSNTTYYDQNAVIFLIIF